MISLISHDGWNRHLRRRLLLPALGLLVGLILWWLIVQLLSQGSPVIAEFSPLAAVDQLLIGLRSGVLIRHASASLLRVGVGLAIAVCLALPLGLLLGLNRNLELVSSAVFQFIRMISPLSWMPIAVMVLGVGDLPVFFLLAVAALWPILLTIISAVRNINPLIYQGGT
jgi:NitT/TauT family transport system permease protein